MKFGWFKKKKPVPVPGPAAVNQQKSKKVLPNSSSVLQNGEEADDVMRVIGHGANSGSVLQNGEEKNAEQRGMAPVDPNTVLKIIEGFWFEYAPILVKYKQIALDLSNLQRKPNDPNAMKKLNSIHFALDRIKTTPELAGPAVNLPKGKSKSSNKKKKRPKAYEVTSEALNQNRFNPSDDPKLAAVQNEIDQATNIRDAYKAFITFAGNADGSFKRTFDENLEPVFPTSNVDMNRFKAKMKNMCRMILDYPELMGRIGDMEQIDHRKEGDTIMATTASRGSKKATLSYNTYVDRAGDEAENWRQAYEYSNRMLGNKTGLSTGLDYSGNHELGHILNSMLFKYMSKNEASFDWKYKQTSGEVVKKVLKKVLKPKDYANLIFKYKHEKTKSGKEVEMLDTKAMKLNELGLTSRYGEYNPNEFFAEAFADVYAHGENARPASIELVKLYEKMRDTMEKDNRKSKGWVDDPYGVGKKKKKKPDDDIFDIV